MATFKEFLKTFDPDENKRGKQFEVFVKRFEVDPKSRTVFLMS